MSTRSRGEHQGPADPSPGWTLPRSQPGPIATARDSREAPAQQLASEERLEVGTEKKPPNKPPVAIFKQGCHGNAPLCRARHV